MRAGLASRPRQPASPAGRGRPGGRETHEFDGSHMRVPPASPTDHGLGSGRKARHAGRAGRAGGQRERLPGADNQRQRQRWRHIRGPCHPYVRTCIHAYMRTCIHAYVTTCMIMCIRAYVHRCLYAYMHVCMHADIQAYVPTCLRVYVHTCLRAYMHRCIHACMHTCRRTCIRAYMHTCIHAHMHTCTHAYMHTCIDTNTHLCIHTCIHTSEFHATLSLRVVRPLLNTRVFSVLPDHAALNCCMHTFPEKHAGITMV